MPIEVRLEAGQPGVLRAAPLAVGLAAERHAGYAVQWFALAGVVLVGYALYGLRNAGQTLKRLEEGDEPS